MGIFNIRPLILLIFLPKEDDRIRASRCVSYCCLPPNSRRIDTDRIENRDIRIGKELLYA